jgi:3-methyladenine DNA glycosylase AlkD
MSVDDLLAQVRAKLRAAGNEADAAAMRRFFKEPIHCYGVKAPVIRGIAREAYREVKAWPPAERNRFATALFRSGNSEEGAVAVYVYQRFARQCAACEFKLFERWIDRYVTNWAHCDGVACWLLAASIANDATLIAELPPWTASANRWKRRAAAVALAPSARRGMHTAAILDIADRLHRDEDDLVRKGVGWLLKETYPKKPAEVVRFLRARRRDTSRLVLRYAGGRVRFGAATVRERKPL